jgi:hypothetical protein
MYVFQYDIPKSELIDRTLWISVWHSGRLGRNVFLGDILIPLENVNNASGKPVWLQLLQQGREVAFFYIQSLKESLFAHRETAVVACMSCYVPVRNLAVLLWGENFVRWWLIGKLLAVPECTGLYHATRSCHVVVEMEVACQFVN